MPLNKSNFIGCLIVVFFLVPTSYKYIKAKVKFSINITHTKEDNMCTILCYLKKKCAIIRGLSNYKENEFGTTNNILR